MGLQVDHPTINTPLRTLMLILTLSSSNKHLPIKASKTLRGGTPPKSEI